MADKLIIALYPGVVQSVVQDGNFWKVVVSNDNNGLSVYTVTTPYVGGCQVLALGDSIGLQSDTSTTGDTGGTASPLIESLTVTGTTEKTITLTLADGTFYEATFTDLNDNAGVVDTNSYVISGTFANCTLTLHRSDGLADVVIPMTDGIAPVAFRVGAVGFPAQGATSFTPLNGSSTPNFAGVEVEVYREGELQYTSTVRGITYDIVSGTIFFYPDLYGTEDIVIRKKAGCAGGTGGGGGGGSQTLAFDPSTRQLNISGGNTVTIPTVDFGDYVATGLETVAEIDLASGVSGRKMIGFWRQYPLQMIFTGTPNSQQVLINYSTLKATFNAGAPLQQYEYLYYQFV